MKWLTRSNTQRKDCWANTGLLHLTATVRKCISFSYVCWKIFWHSLNYSIFLLHWQCVVRTGRRQQPAAFTRMSSLGKPVSVKTAIRFVVLAPGGREAVFSDVLQGALWWMFICLYRWHKLLSVSLSLGPTQSPAAFCHWIITIKTWLCGTV